MSRGLGGRSVRTRVPRPQAPITALAEPDPVPVCPELGCTRVLWYGMPHPGFHAAVETINGQPAYSWWGKLGQPFRLADLDRIREGALALVIHRHANPEDVAELGRSIERLQAARAGL